MTLIELPRAVEAYFSFAELPATDRGRQFTITFTYMDGSRVDRLQWWWQLHKGLEKSGDALIVSLRQEAIARFRQHIERWLVNSRRCLRGGDPFPLLHPVPSEEPVPENADAPPAIDSAQPRHLARVAAGA